MITLAMCLSIVVGQKASDQRSTDFVLIDMGEERPRLFFDEINRLLREAPDRLNTGLLDRRTEGIAVALRKTQITREPISGILYYQGIIKGKPKSLVTLAIKRDGIKSLISDTQGNYTIGMSIDKPLKIKKQKRKQSTNWACETNTISNSVRESKKATKFIEKTLDRDTLGVFFVCDYDLYLSFGASRQAVLDYVYDMFSQVQALYIKEDIVLIIEDIDIWETPDPYDKTSNAATLLSFRETIGTDYPAHFAHLLSAKETSGGIAFINGLCNRDYSYAMSIVNAYIASEGEYSWDVHVVAHELGHNMGSQHTHECAWGPNGTDAIDACGGPEEACINAPIPQEGGTIMSYCNTASVGVNFSLGFGKEPGDRMRSTIAQCRTYPGQICAEALVLSENGSVVTEPIISGRGANSGQATHARWYRFIPPNDGKIDISSCNQGIDTRLFVYSGSCQDLTLLDKSDDGCLSGNGYNYASQIIGLPLQRDSAIYIEWDDRWSNKSFEFNITFKGDTIEPCYNEIQDGDETGIDCGGSCVPCPTPCNDNAPLPMLIDSTILYISQDIVTYDGAIISPAMLHIISQEGLEIGVGFVLQAGGQLETDIENCNK